LQQGLAATASVMKDRPEVGRHTDRFIVVTLIEQIAGAVYKAQLLRQCSLELTFFSSSGFG
jgi:hypothetical protein